MASILYHANCFDGLAAAWVASNAPPNAGTYPTLIPCSYGEAPPDLEQFRNATVYVLDFSFPLDYMLELDKVTSFLQVIDHHKTAQETCNDLQFCMFDMEKSGASLTWDYFYPGKARLPLINYIEDRDLWRFKLPDSAAVHAWIASYPKDILIYNWLSDRLLENFEACASEGKAILRFEDQKIEELANEARLVQIGSYEVPLVNAPYQFGSDVAHLLLERYPDRAFAAYFCIDKNGKTRYGLRGRDSDNFDVSAIAKQYGGGGHKKAAGYEV